MLVNKPGEHRFLPFGNGVALLLVCLFPACARLPRPQTPIDWAAESARWNTAIGDYMGESVPGYEPAPARIALYRRRADIPRLSFSPVLRRGNAVADLATETLHVPVWRESDPPDGPKSPLRMLRHELGHLHLYRALAFRLPPDLAERFGIDSLSPTPWWLDEGWAAHVEDAAIENGRLSPPPHNIERALDLQLLIWKRRCPSPLSVLAKTDEQAGGTVDYAVAWGLVHWILLHPDPEIRLRHRAGWHRYIQACRRGFYPEAANAAALFAADFLDADGSPLPDWGLRWRRRVASEGTAEFRRIFIEPMGEQEWASSWMTTMAGVVNAAQ